MKGLILAAGKGTRLLPLTRHVPRCLIPVNGKPIIHRAVMLLKSAGIDDIFVNVHHLGDRIQERLADGRKFGVNVRYVREIELSGLPAGIRSVHKFLNGQPFVVMDDNVVADLDLADVIAYHEEQGADATIVLRPVPGAKAHGRLDVDGDISLSALIGEAPDESGYLGPTGIRVFSQRVFDFIPEGTTRSLAETLALMVQAECHIEGYVMDGYWSDLNTWEQYAYLLWQVGRGFVPEPPEV